MHHADLARRQRHGQREQRTAGRARGPAAHIGDTGTALTTSMSATSADAGPDRAANPGANTATHANPQSITDTIANTRVPRREVCHSERYRVQRVPSRQI